MAHRLDYAGSFENNPNPNPNQDTLVMLSRGLASEA